MASTPSKREVQRARQSLARMAVQRDAGQSAGERVQKRAGEFVGADRVGLLPVHCQLACHAQSDDGGDVEGPRSEAVFLAAAQDLGRDAGPQGLRAQVQAPAPFGP